MYAVSGVGTSLAVGAVLICVGIGLSGWKDWMPVTDPAYSLYIRWFQGLAPVVAAFGFLLAALLWLTSLYPYRMAYQTAAMEREKIQKEE